MKKNWIAGAISKPGSLHEELHIPMDKKIPANKLEKAAHKPGKEGKRARLVQTLKKLHSKKHESTHEKEVKGGEKGDKKLHKIALKKHKENKIEKVMEEFKEHRLKSSSKRGPKVTNPKQAIAIAISESKKMKKNKK